jgi:hypothetical protein
VVAEPSALVVVEVLGVVVEVPELPEVLGVVVGVLEEPDSLMSGALISTLPTLKPQLRSLFSSASLPPSSHKSASEPEGRSAAGMVTKMSYFPLPSVLWTA